MGRLPDGNALTATLRDFLLVFQRSAAFAAEAIFRIGRLTTLMTEVRTSEGSGSSQAQRGH